MGVYIPSLSSWLVNAQRVLEFLDTPNENFYVENKENTKNNICQKNSKAYHTVEFKNITFGYAGKKYKYYFCLDFISQRKDAYLLTELT